MGEVPDNGEEGSPLPPFQIERDAKQLAITSCFTKTLVKQRTEIAKKEKRKLGLNERKEKDMVRVVTLKEDARKLQPRKLTRATPSHTIIDLPA